MSSAASQPAVPAAPQPPAGKPDTKYYAHTAVDIDGKLLPESEWQPLAEHLRSVAELARQFAEPFGGGDQALLAGLLHDLGKYRKEFQRYLRGTLAGGAATQHAIFGAVEAVSQSDQLLAAALGIQGHHAGLHDLLDLQRALSDHPLQPREALPGLMAAYTQELGPLPSPPPAPAWASERRASAELYTRLLFSCLVDADRLDTAGRSGWGAPLDAGRLLSAVRSERACKAAARPDSEINHARNQIFDACLAQAALPPGFFSLTVPTGGGKTLASMAFALAHAERHLLRRVIAVIPYLSIIEQNAAEYRRVLGSDAVVEHHSAAAPPGAAADAPPSALDLAAENWDAPVIVTTSVQFIESLFAAAPAKCRKLHRIARSVVIFDEAQTLPAHLLSPLFSVLRDLARNSGASFVFCSATLPAFRRSPSLPPDFFEPDEMREIAPDPPAAFRRLRRVNYHIPARDRTLAWPELAALLAAEPQVLCIVNLTGHAAALWQALRSFAPPDQAPIHLSAAMCPEHRLGLVRTIAARLQAGQPCRVVSTQLVEAGVDLDFPVVWRAIGPLDSIVQAAGRCNREGIWARGQVHVFRPAEHALPPGTYRAAADLTAAVLTGLGPDAAERLATDPGVFPAYFQRLFALVETDGSGRASVQRDREMLRFREVARSAKVIRDCGQPVVVPFGAAPGMVAALRARPAGAARFTAADLRSLQRFMVNVRTPQFQRLQALGQVRPLLPNLDLFALQDGNYHAELGVIAGERPLEDFLQ